MTAFDPGAAWEMVASYDDVPENGDYIRARLDGTTFYWREKPVPPPLVLPTAILTIIEVTVNDGYEVWGGLWYLRDVNTWSPLSGVNILTDDELRARIVSFRPVSVPVGTATE